MTSTRSDELLAPVGNAVELCYQTFGSPDDEPLLLVMGLGGPMTWWPLGWCEALAELGFFVVRYDNRDAGRSTRMTGRVTKGQVILAGLGVPQRAPYSLSDLAADGLGLLDHLGIDKAHVVGMSMGGMIVQTMAITHPERIRSVASIMSTTGQRTVGWQHPSLLPRLLAKRPTEVAAYLDAFSNMNREIGSPGYPEEDDVIRARGQETWDRGLNAAGVLRQMLAILSQPNRTKDLTEVKAPFLVVHGLADKMVHASGGRATSLAVPNSELLLIDGMGHNLPEPLWETITGAIRRNADRA